ncbi:172_t:CDS:1, partial [Diversispora eburnea]
TYLQRKVNSVKKDLIKYEVLEYVIAYINVIKFQKWELLHTYLLLILHPDDKPMSSNNYDEIVQAEISNSVVNPKTYVTVTT